MAIVANTATTYTGATIREDLSDVIYNIAPMDTPFLSVVVKVKLKQHSLSGKSIRLSLVLLTDI